MKWKNFFGIILIGACVAVIALGIYSMIAWNITLRDGTKVLATVTAVPRTCGRVNSIKVELNGITHIIKISRADCRNSVYKVGQQVTLMQHPDYEELVWPDGRPDIVLACLIVLLLLAVYSNIPEIKKYRQQQINARTSKR